MNKNMDTDQPPKVEKILISRAQKPAGQVKTAPPTLARKWRAPRLRLTAIGGILALVSLGFVFFTPRLLKNLIMAAFWNTPYGKSSYSDVFADLSMFILWDEDHGFLVTYILGIILGWLLFICMAHVLEFIGLPIYRENERT